MQWVKSLRTIIEKNILTHSPSINGIRSFGIFFSCRFNGLGILLGSLDRIDSNLGRGSFAHDNFDLTQKKEFQQKVGSNQIGIWNWFLGQNFYIP